MTALVWLTRDLRVHDHPALTAALEAHERVIPVFCLDDRLLHGRHASGPRTQFMLECLHQLGDALRERGGGLVIRRAPPERGAARAGARDRSARECTAPRTRARSPAGARVVCNSSSSAQGRGCAPKPGLHAVDDLGSASVLPTGEPFRVFSPFHRAWSPGRPARGPTGAGRAAAAAVAPPAPGRLPLARRARARVGSRRSAAAAARDPAGSGSSASSTGLCAPTPTAAISPARTARRASRRTCTSAACPYARSRSRLPRGRRPGGVPPAAVLARLPSPRPAAQPRTTLTPELQSPLPRPCDGAAMTSGSPPGAKGAPAIRSSTPACASCGARAGCTTACGSWSARSSRRTSRSTGAPASGGSCAGWSTATRPTTTATGSGSHRSAPTRSRRTGGSTTRPATSSVSIPTASTSAVTSPS